MADLQASENFEGSNIFGADPFKEFTEKKFKELLKPENMRELIRMREQALDHRAKTESENLKRDFENKRFSPRTFQNKKIELEKWVSKEREKIRRSQKDIERGWMLAADAIKRVIIGFIFIYSVRLKEIFNSSRESAVSRDVLLEISA